MQPSYIWYGGGTFIPVANLIILLNFPEDTFIQGGESTLKS